jgi:hypothetical protein
MAIRKYGNEPAKVETRVEDNDRETLEKLAALAQETLDKSRKQDDTEKPSRS